uniref:Uncharacterized protein n=1 Tax=Virus NIOZ-UU159 TaxID=2763270 RepID=A0A7S9SUI3_9VIRU|nr:MAG: hypothetical protein NIOZUU159_00068 [Virus NIOZ-UU159]
MCLYTAISLSPDLLGFNISRGRHGLPASVNIRNSFVGICQDIDINMLINPFLLNALSNRVTNMGSPVIPNRVPFKNTFVIFLFVYKL